MRLPCGSVLSVHLLALSHVVSHVTGSPTSFLLLTETGECGPSACGNRDGSGFGDITACELGSPVAARAAQWAADRLHRLLLANSSTAIRTVNTCGEMSLGRWRLVEALASYNTTSPPHVLLASSLKDQLVPVLTALRLSFTALLPLLPASQLTAASRLVRHLGWSQVGLLSDDVLAKEVGSRLLAEEVCLTWQEPLPTPLSSKASITSLVSRLEEAEVKHLVVVGPGAAITKLLRNMHQLNGGVASILAFPWDGPLREEWTANTTVTVLVAQETLLGEFLDQLQGREKQLVGPMAWQIMKTIYGIALLNDSSVDDATVLEGLRLTPAGFPLKQRVEQYSGNSNAHTSLGLYENGEFSWPRSELEPACLTCSCSNGLGRGEARWRYEAWVTALAALAGLGILCCFVVFVFLCSQCGQVLEGGQFTSFLLLGATGLTFSAMLPYCFQPDTIDCVLRSVGPAGSLTILVSALLSRSLLLATSDTEGLPGHASGCLQVAMLLLMLGVEAAVLSIESWHAGTWSTDVSTGQCLYRGWPWLGLLVWPAALLLVQTFLSPAIWRSRRNYKEGVLFSLASLALCLVSGAWVTVYILCTELYGNQWEDISVCAGLVSSATVVLLLVFLPKVYLMTMWGAGRDISLHVPGTATSTLHTDTLDFIPSHVYKTPVDQHTVAYVNLGPRPGNMGRERPSSVHECEATYMLAARGMMQPAYRLDRNTEPASNLSWEPFQKAEYGYAGSSHQADLQLSPGVPSTRL